MLKWQQKIEINKTVENKMTNSQLILKRPKTFIKSKNVHQIKLKILKMWEKKSKQKKKWKKIPIKS